MVDTNANPDAASLTARLTQILGREHVLADLAAREFYSQDFGNEALEIADLAIRPENVAQVSASVAAAAAAGFVLVPRGGGMSYTRGYLSAVRGSVTVDLRRMNRIHEINLDDMYVVVDAGVTWGQLYDALKDKGVRTGFWGTLSGLHATVGGALSQDAALYGSGIHGTAAANVQGLEVVLADGSVIRTGSWAHRKGTPFLRYFGPDLTGIFLADTGAFAIKVRAALALVPAPPAMSAASFGFDAMEASVAAQVDICRLRAASECFGFDPYFNEGFESMGLTLGEGISLLGHVARSGGGFWNGIRRSLRIVRAGKRILRKVKYSVHVTVDGRDEGANQAVLDDIRAIVAAEGGWEIDNAIPTVMRARPFGSIRTNLLGPEGQIWMPLHSFFPLSKALDAANATQRFLADRARELNRHDISFSILTAMAATNFMIEPSFYWRDELGPLRLSVIEPEFQAKWRGLAPNPAARAVAVRLRRELAAIYAEMGGTQQQIGKYYAFRDVIEPETWRVLEGIKHSLDPEGRINPGALGLK